MKERGREGDWDFENNLDYLKQLDLKKAEGGGDSERIRKLIFIRIIPTTARKFEGDKRFKELFNIEKIFDLVHFFLFIKNGQLNLHFIRGYDFAWDV